MNRFLRVLDKTFNHNPVQESNEEESAACNHQWDVAEAEEYRSANQSLEDEIGGETQEEGSVIKVVACGRANSIP